MTKRVVTYTAHEYNLIKAHLALQHAVNSLGSFDFFCWYEDFSETECISLKTLHRCKIVFSYDFAIVLESVPRVWWFCATL